MYTYIQINIYRLLSLVVWDPSISEPYVPFPEAGKELRKHIQITTHTVCKRNVYQKKSDHGKSKWNQWENSLRNLYEKIISQHDLKKNAYEKTLSEKHLRKLSEKIHSEKYLRKLSEKTLSEKYNSKLSQKTLSEKYLRKLSGKTLSEKYLRKLSEKTISEKCLRKLSD